MKNEHISSGWKDDLQGHIHHTDSHISVKAITLDLDSITAWALCNLLTSERIDANSCVLEESQKVRLRNLGAAIGALIDHHAKKNMDKDSDESKEKAK